MNSTVIKIFNMSLGVMFYIFVTLRTVTAVSYDDPKCIVDESKSATSHGNYIDCTSAAMVTLGKTECCEIEADKGCCKPGGSSEKMKLIGICLGTITASLGIILIYFLWCRKTKNPHILKFMAFTKQGYHTIQQKCSCLTCCRHKVQEREKKEEMKRQAEEIPAYQLPTENDSNAVNDTFWQGPMVKS